MTHTGERPAADEDMRKRAVLRLLLGQLQIIGATAGLFLLVQKGVTDWTVGVVAATSLVILTSRLLFRKFLQTKLSSRFK